MTFTSLRARAESACGSEEVVKGFKSVGPAAPELRVIAVFIRSLLLETPFVPSIFKSSQHVRPGAARAADTVLAAQQTYCASAPVQNF